MPQTPGAGAAARLSGTEIWWRVRDLNPGPTDYDSAALTAELTRLGKRASLREAAASCQVKPLNLFQILAKLPGWARAPNSILPSWAEVSSALSLAVALEGSGLRLALVEPRLAPAIAPEGWDSRIYALSPGSVAFLERLGVWPELPQDRLTRVEAMEIYGDDGAARLDFSAYDAGLRELAVIVENRLLQQALWRAAQAAVARVYCPAELRVAASRDGRSAALAR